MDNLMELSSAGIFEAVLDAWRRYIFNYADRV